MKTVFGLALACGAVGTTVLAQSVCPVADDLRSGIHLDFADGTTETYRLISEAIVSVDGYEGTEPYFRLDLAYGTHLLSYLAVVDGRPDEASRQTYDYGVTAAELPVPTDGGRFTAQVTVTASDGPRREDQLQAYVGVDPMTIAGCTYQAMDLIIAYDTEDNYMESIRYFPELGFGYLLWNQSDSGQSDENVLTLIRTGK
jgi:hypothetical protein